MNTTSHGLHAGGSVGLAALLQHAGGVLSAYATQLMVAGAPPPPPPQQQQGEASGVHIVMGPQYPHTHHHHDAPITSTWSAMEGLGGAVHNQTTAAGVAMQAPADVAEVVRAALAALSTAIPFWQVFLPWVAAYLGCWYLRGGSGMEGLLSSCRDILWAPITQAAYRCGVCGVGMAGGRELTGICGCAGRWHVYVT
jgi:hypothetical protein